jgi:hypothetical protein
VTTSGDLHVVRIDQRDPRLGRHVVHDPRSRAYAVNAPPLDSVLRSFRHRVFSPNPLPRQTIGCCTGVDQCVRADAHGNRIRGVILGLDDAVRIYTRATQLDGFPGEYPADDTGSSGLAAAKAAQEAGIIDRYEWIFGGVGQVLAALRDRPVGVGTRWHEDMFNPDPRTFLVTPTGPIVGGHQWSIIGYSKRFEAFEGLCWWGDDFGSHGLFRIRKAHLAELLADDGDAHVTYRAKRNA